MSQTTDKAADVVVAMIIRSVQNQLGITASMAEGVYACICDDLLENGHVFHTPLQVKMDQAGSDEGPVISYWDGKQWHTLPEEGGQRDT